MDKLNWIKEKIKETERELQKSKINIATADCYARLIEIHKALYDLLYFKVNQEETFLIK